MSASQHTEIWFFPICSEHFLFRSFPGEWLQEAVFFSNILFCSTTCSRKKAVCAFLLPFPVEAYIHPAGVPNQFFISRADCQGSELPKKASHCMSHKCDGLTAAHPDCWARAIQEHLGLSGICSCLQDFQRNHYCSTATQCSDRFLYEESSFTQMWSEHCRVRFWLVLWIRGWPGSWLHCCLILLFSTQGMCSPLKQCCSPHGPPKSLHLLLSQSMSA